MAATVSFTEKVPAKVSASRLFQAGVVHFHTLLPTFLPEYVKSATIVEGDGMAGSVKLYAFTEGAPYPFIKEYIDVLDMEKLETQYSVIEGGDLRTKTTSVVYRVKVVPGAGDDTTSSVLTLTAEYKLLPGINYTKEVEMEKALLNNLVANMEKYLLEHPDLYV